MTSQGVLQRRYSRRFLRSLLVRLQSAIWLRDHPKCGLCGNHKYPDGEWASDECLCAKSLGLVNDEALPMLYTSSTTVTGRISAKAFSPQNIPKDARHLDQNRAKGIARQNHSGKGRNMVRNRGARGHGSR